MVEAAAVPGLHGAALQTQASLVPSLCSYRKVKQALLVGPLALTYLQSAGGIASTLGLFCHVCIRHSCKAVAERQHLPAPSPVPGAMALHEIVVVFRLSRRSIQLHSRPDPLVVALIVFWVVAVVCVVPRRR